MCVQEKKMKRAEKGKKKKKKKTRREPCVAAWRILVGVVATVHNFWVFVDDR